MAASTHWRIYIDANGGDATYTSFAEIEMRGVPGGPDLCTGGTASASAEITGNEATRAVDDSTTTRWSASGTANIWWRYVFPSAVEITGLAITPYVSYTSRCPKDFRLQRSDDGGATWVDVLTFTNQTGYSLGVTSVFRAPVTCVISDAGGNWNASTAWVNGVVPTSRDDVRATATSGNLTVNVDGYCRSLDLTGYVGTLNHGTGKFLYVGNTMVGSPVGSGGGAFILSTGMTYARHSMGWVRFVATTDNGGAGWPIDCMGKVTPTFRFDGAGGKWSLQSAVFLGSYGYGINLSYGHLVTNGYAIQAGFFTTAAGTTLDLGNSTVTIVDTNTGTTSSPWSMSPTATFICGTSTIRYSYDDGGAFTFAGADKTYNNVVFEPTANYQSSVTITGANTFANLTVTTSTNILLAGNQIVTGTFTMTGSSPAARVKVKSGTAGTPRTITAATVSGSNLELADITGAGAASWDFSGTIAGDLGGNTGITFTTARTLYWKGSGSLFSDATQWYLGSGGTGGAAGRIPLPQDTIRFDAASAVSSVVTCDLDVGTIDCTGAVGSGRVGFSSDRVIYGSLIASPGLWLYLSARTLTFCGRGSYVLDFAGWAIPNGIVTVEAYGGTLTLQSSITDFAYVNLNYGTFDANGHDLSGLGLKCSATTTPRTLKMGSGTWTLTGTVDAAAAGLTLIPGSSKLILNSGASGFSFSGGGHTFATVETGSAPATGAITITGSNTFSSFKVYPGRTVIFAGGTTQTFTGDFVAVGTASNIITLQSSDTTQATLFKTSGNVVANWLSLTKTAATGGAHWYAGANSADGGGNTGWIFSDFFTGEGLSAQPIQTQNASGSVILRVYGSISQTQAAQTERLVNKTLMGPVVATQAAQTETSNGNLEFPAATTINQTPQLVFSAGRTAIATQEETATFLEDPGGYVLAGQPASFFFAVNATGQGAGGIPTGTIVVFDGATIIGIATLKEGTAIFTTSDLRPGTHTIQGIYSGDAYYGGSTSGTVTLEVTLNFILQSATLKMRINGVFTPVTLYERVGDTWQVVTITTRQAATQTSFDDLGLHTLIHQDLPGQYAW